MRFLPRDFMWLFMCFIRKILMWGLWSSLWSLAGTIVFLNSIAFKITFIYFVHMCMHEYVCIHEYMCTCVSTWVSQYCMWKADDNCGGRKPFLTMWVTLRPETYLIAKDFANKEIKTCITILTHKYKSFSHKYINRWIDENPGPGL